MEIILNGEQLPMLMYLHLLVLVQQQQTKFIVCNTSEILQLNFSDLNINGTTPNTSGQYLGYNGSSVNWIGAKKHSM